jgi:hypothetical protein
MSAWRKLAVGGLALACACGGSSQAPPIPGVPTGAPLVGLTLFGGWQPARALPAPIHSDGWEDSSFISSDGRRLYFGYTQKDVTLWTEDEVAVYDGAPRPGARSEQWNIYEATIVDGGWSVVDSTANLDDPDASLAAAGVDVADTKMVMSRLGSVSGDTYMTTRASVADGWAPPERLDAPVSTACRDDNPTLSDDGTQIYFDSTRADAAGTSCAAVADGPARRIWVTTFAGGTWSLPVVVGGAPSAGDLHWQPFVRDGAGELWWTGHDARCGDAVACVYRALREADGTWGDDALVMQPTAYGAARAGDVFAVGEASLTGDGHLLYFTYGVKTATGTDFDIGVAWRP